MAFIVLRLWTMKRLLLAAAFAAAFGSTSGCGVGAPLSVADGNADIDAGASGDAAPSFDAGVDAAPSCRELGSAACGRRADCQALYCPSCNWGQSFVGCQRQGGGELSCNERPCPSSSDPPAAR